MAFDLNSDTRISIDPSCVVHDDFELVLRTDTSRFIAEEGCILRGKFDLMARDTLVHFKAGSRVTGHAVMILAERGDQVIIGEDASISGVTFRTSDGHPLFCLKTGRRYNPSGNIILGPGTGVAEGAVLLRGVVTGEGAIIGNNAVVIGRKKPYPAHCVMMGNPARVIRTDVCWRDRFGDTIDSPRTLSHRRET